MKLEQFRILNYRSVVNSGWCRFSPDGVTVLVGQNESGKTSILEALHKTFSAEPLTPDELRYGADLPIVHLKLRVTVEEVLPHLRKLTDKELQTLRNWFSAAGDIVEIRFYWLASTAKPASYEGFVELVDDNGEFADAMVSARAEPTPADVVATAAEAIAAVASKAPPPTLPAPIDGSDLGGAVYEAGPTIEMFKQDIGLLPNSIDIDSNHQLLGEGARAAQNFLTVADIDLPSLLKSDQRAQENYLDRANKLVTRDFSKFWTQVIGKDRPLRLECKLHFHGPATGPQKIGQPYLVFWISDDLTRLYPRQRSTGVRWFVSFFLQLKATEKRGAKRIFLLDEPGANLHSRAQQDVLRLINQLSKTIPIIYSTHSQDMIEFDKLYRIRAVQRDGDLDDSPTRVFEAEHLAAASSDTLSPVLTAMGIDLTRQQLIPKRGNILLEEISAQYYLRAFSKLTRSNLQLSFISATGVGKLPQLVFMFLGWGFEFGIVVDDDAHGRAVFNELKRDLYSDEHEIASAHMLKISGCSGIEDMFAPEDFRTHVCTDYVSREGQAISAWLKTSGKSKPVLAYGFLKRVEDGALRFDDLTAATRDHITRLLDRIGGLSAVKPSA